MTVRPTVREVIVVEGRYDKNTVLGAVDAVVIETAGFGIFSDDEKINLLRRLADKRGLIILTDSDGAGFLIRGHLKGMLSGVGVKHAYVPDIPGRERRKRLPSKEGLLGVEGMRRDVIVDALVRAGATFAGGAEAVPKSDQITKTDLYFAGLSGTPDSAVRRAELLKALDLPERLSPNGLLDVLNALFTRSEFLSHLS